MCDRTGQGRDKVARMSTSLTSWSEAIGRFVHVPVDPSISMVQQEENE